MSETPPTRDDIAEAYLEQLPYEPYPFQEEAILSWFSSEQGVLVSAPTGMGKTMIAEAGLFEALKTGTRAYYTTPLIALTEQKYREFRESAVRWGFSADEVGLVTGNRRENPEATVLVVVAEILFNRLIHRAGVDTEEETPPGDVEKTPPEAVRFDDVGVVVMDEFHSFTDNERGIVWEFTLELLPSHIRTLLISATVGNAYDFVSWLRQTTDRDLDLIQSDVRKVPLTFSWVGDQLLTEQLERMAAGSEEERLTPALVFCFNREECWNVAEQIKGKKIIDDARQSELVERLKQDDWSKGAGPKIKQLLLRGVGVHHAGVMPKYRRIVEELFQKKLLSVTICTETLAAGINLPARSVVLPSILKGPPGKKRIVEASTAHQIFGRAGRPQFDAQGYVFVLAHEDDVKIARWKEKYDQIPDDTKDPKLRQMKKKIKKKMPKRRATEQYWSEEQFRKLIESPPGKLVSRGPLPWRMLAHMLDASPEVEPIRNLVSRRLMSSKKLEQGQKQLDRMLLTLWRAGYVSLDPNPLDFGIEAGRDDSADASSSEEEKRKATSDREKEGGESGTISLFGQTIFEEKSPDSKKSTDSGSFGDRTESEEDDSSERYRPRFANPTERLELLRRLRGVNPLYGIFLVNQLGIADRRERLQAFESVLEMPGSVARHVRVPDQEELPPGPLATNRLDPQLLQLGLALPEELAPKEEDPRDRRFGAYAEEKTWVLTLAEKLRRMFDYDYGGSVDVRTTPVWAAGEILEFGGDFNKFVTSRNLQKQEGVIFRHLLRLILLLSEFLDLVPPETDEEEWKGDLREIIAELTACCRRIDPSSTQEVLQQVESREEAIG